MGSIEASRQRERTSEIEPRLPAELTARFLRVQAQELRLVRGVRIDGRDLQLAATERAHEAHRDLTCGHTLFVLVGPEIPAAGEALRVLEQALREQQVARERLEHVLPWPGRARVADLDDVAARGAAHDVGNEPVFRPVAAADDVARARARHADAALFEERAPIGGRHELGRALAGAVRVVTTHRVGLAVRLDLLAVLVALVTGDDHDRAHRRKCSHGLEHVGGAHHVRLEGVDRLAVALAHQRLRRHVQHDLRLVRRRHRGERLQIANVAEGRRDQLGGAPELEQARRGIGRQGVARDFGSHRRKPVRCPGAFEAGMTRQEHPLTCVEIRKRTHRAGEHSA